MPKCNDCGEEASPSNVLFGGYGKLVCGDCLFKLWDKYREKPMTTSFKDGFDFVVKYYPETNLLLLRRKNGISCLCPYREDDNWCGSSCPHFVIENCSIVDKKCCLVLTCGKHLSRVVEIL